MIRFGLFCWLILKLLYISKKYQNEYQKIWIPFLQEEPCGEMGAANPVDKYVVVVKKNNVVVGHLPLICSAKFCKDSILLSSCICME